MLDVELLDVELLAAFGAGVVLAFWPCAAKQQENAASASVATLIKRAFRVREVLFVLGKLLIRWGSPVPGPRRCPGSI